VLFILFPAGFFVIFILFPTGIFLFFWQHLKFFPLPLGPGMVLFFRSQPFFPAMQLSIPPQQFIALICPGKALFMQLNVKFMPPTYDSFAEYLFTMMLGKDACLVFIHRQFTCFDAF